MNAAQQLGTQEPLDDEGFLKEMSSWSEDMAYELAERNGIGPLNDDHWKVIECVRDFYRQHGYGPPIVYIGKATGLSSRKICELFPCGVARGAYRLAGLPRPQGCL